MSAPKFMPGPWRAAKSEHSPDFYSIEQVDENGIRLEDIAYMTLNKNGSLRENARLIAAAPELFSALEHIAATCEGRAAEVARAALAKAVQP